MRSHTLGLAVVLTLVCVPSCSRDRSAKPPGTEGSAAPTVPDLRAALASKTPPDFVTVDDADRHLWKAERQFYARNGYHFAWTQKNRPSRDANALIDALNEAHREGLDPTGYDLQTIAALRTERSFNPFRRNALDPARAVEADLRLTFMFLKYASHLASGQVDPEGMDPQWVIKPRAVDLAGLLDRALDGGGIRATLQEVAPQHPQYSALRDALARYHEIAKRGGWPALPAPFPVKKGETSSQVAMLRARLAASGDLPGGDVSAVALPPGRPGNGPATNRQPEAELPPANFDAAVVAALERFEQRHGLKVDGVLDKEVIAAMSVPVEARIAQMELNLERWRWLPASLGQRYILVNIPSFQLDAFDANGPPLSMRVVVGKADTPTPVFMDEMTTVVFSPHWNVPASIARNETLPAVLNDPAYLERNNIEVVKGSEVLDPSTIDWNEAADDFTYRFRQKPGTSNSLGLVKFLFPNHFNVYLHDTPADALFNRVERDFSHGCVRLEQPVELARWVLRDQPQWTPERIAQAMRSGAEQGVRITQPIPVYLLYLTAWVDKDGITQFRDDLYGHDALQGKIQRARSVAVQSARR